MTLEPCCYTCRRCNHVACCDTDPSPLEAEKVCAQCVTAEEAEAVMAA